jgi:hypothetical protein
MRFFGYLFHYCDLLYANFGLFISLLRIFAYLPKYQNNNENQTQKRTRDSVQTPDTLSQLTTQASLLSKENRQSQSHSTRRAKLSKLTTPASELS